MSKAVGKIFVITLSDKDEKIKTPGAVLPEKHGVRETEIAMLVNLFDIAASRQKSFKAANECLDCIGQIESLSDKELEILLTQADLDYLKSAWEGTAEGRPLLWNRCRSLIRQLENPAEKESPEPEEDKKTEPATRKKTK